MPLVRVEVRNEYGLGMPELYTETNSEDPKAVLDGVAVAGLVGILRQLGDLSEFAAEVFYGIQEQVLITSSRSQTLGERVYKIEAALHPLEKAILAQRSHLHFAYTSGSHWHTRARTEQNHFTYSDLPRCIMDSYEVCRDPPRLHKLDKFDTGGRGSCFKRYSDPTYFQKTLAGPYGTHLQSVPREKKARRSKKKRSLLRHRDITHDAPVFTHGSGMDFASQNSNGKTSPSPDVSTIHVVPKYGNQPEMEYHLSSFDSRNGSGYIDCLFRPSYSTQPEENEAMELSSGSKVQQNAYLDLASLHENSGVSDENVENSNCQENNGPRSSFITWDEKLEIIESTGGVIDTTEISCTTDMLATKENEDLNSGVDLINFDFHNERLAISVVNGDQPDEIKSEMDYYMDPLNIIESESETDVCCQTKRELKHYYVEGECKEDNLDDSKMNLKSHVPDCTYLTKAMCSPSSKQMSHESHVEAHIFSNNETSVDKSKSDLSENSYQGTSPQIADASLISSTSADDFKSETGEIHGTNLGTVASNGIFSNSRELNSQHPSSKQILITHESTKPLSSTSGAQTTLTNSAMFWTNGGLFGLAPSKPPDFGSPPAVGSDSVAKSKDDLIQHSSQKNATDSHGYVAEADMVCNGSKSESSSRCTDSNSSNHAQEHDCNASNTTTPAVHGPVAEDDPIKSIKDKGISSSRIFEFSNRLLVRQLSLVGDEKLASSVRTDVPQKPTIHTGYHAAVGKPFGEQFGNESLLKSPSSPPLQHMRISFQPIDGFETSKLKLKFPDECNCHESSIDVFLSFQLVPEPAIPLHESGSDSDDDDTFCRSSPYASEDCCSHHSESNSEQWDSGDSPRLKDHELVDAFGSISSAESVSSSLVNRISFPEPRNCGHRSLITEDGDEPYHSGQILEIPYFDSVRTSLDQIISNSDGKNVPESCFPKERTPPPPSLPPSEWQGVKLHPDIIIDRKDALSEGWTYALDQTLPEPTVPQQPKPALLKLDHFVETVDRTPYHKLADKPNLDLQNESNRTTCMEVADDKEDLLQQIRTNL